jgi:hypothetical protein
MELGLFEIYIFECSYCGKDLKPKERCCNEEDCSCQFHFCNKECLDKYNEENNTTIG